MQMVSSCLHHLVSIEVLLTVKYFENYRVCGIAVEYVLRELLFCQLGQLGN